MTEDARTAVRIRKEAEAALAGLGDNAQQVAGSLHFHGITGLRERATACPIARFLVRQLAEVEEAAVSCNTITLWLTGPDIIELVTPPEIASFSAAFDLGHFDDLVEQPPSGGDR